jgi:hypothetical protein
MVAPPTGCSAPNTRPCRRRQGWLDDELLRQLADESWTHLDLASGADSITPTGFQAALQRLPLLQAADLRGCSLLTVQCYRQLAACCPGLRTLRLGGGAPASAVAWQALPDILPRLAPLLASDGQPLDSWEEALEGGPPSPALQHPCVLHRACSLSVWPACGCWGAAPACAAAAARLSLSLQGLTLVALAAPRAAAVEAEPGRLHHLDALIWPHMPEAARQLVARQCPRVAVNPALKPDRLTGEAPPAAWDIAVPLDRACAEACWPPAELCGGSPGEAGCDQVAAAQPRAAPGARPDAPRGAGGGGGDVLPLAEKFRLAYVLREQRLWAVDKKQRARLHRQAVRHSKALQAEEVWLDEA